ncbi:GNAT family N-acetyltransferase [Olivibacter sp. SDN3]|uniref:GNAT family N-acetyltransferase n=1 Tax=Olivibacter sp. SDN3 TaxID=2764720 RepID=UPI0016511541|nr:GNAT family N-acetyltransferase [Olivibacter sp. SDN3]QNL48087.1 GNAT family N-acetyltransferase [Olivibacter sp. SDN3]
MFYQSDTIIIREFKIEEISLFSELFDSLNVTRYLPYKTPEEYREMFHTALKDYKKGLFSRWGVFNTVNNDFIGMCLARHFADIPSQLEIGYTLSERYWGKGIATEVCSALVHYCFSHTDRKEVVAVTALDNIGSQKVLAKTGFKQKDNLIRDNDELAYFVIQRNTFLAALEQ